MKILAATLSFFISMALTSDAGSTNPSNEDCEDLQWLESKGKGICDFKRDFCGWKNTKWKFGFCEPDKDVLSVLSIANNGGTKLWRSDTEDNNELTINVSRTPLKITIQGQITEPGGNGEILIFDVKFHRLSTSEAITSIPQSSTSLCADTDTTNSDHWCSSLTHDASMTTTSTLSDVLTTAPIVMGGVVVATILLIIVVFVFIRRKLKKDKNNGTASDVPPPGVSSAHRQEDPHFAASSTSVLIKSTLDRLEKSTVHQEPKHVTAFSVVVDTDTIHRKPEHPRAMNPDKCFDAHDRPFHGNKISFDSTTRRDQGNYDYVEDPPHETPPGAAGGTGSSTLAADDIYNHTHDSDNKQLRRPSEGGGGIYSTLATEDTYSHLQGKEHNRFDRQGQGRKNPHLVTAPGDNYNHL